MAKGNAERIRITSVKEDALLLDWLFLFLNDKSKQTVKSILRSGQVHVNGRIVTQFNYALKVGDKVEIEMVRQEKKSPHPMMEIVYEDADIVVINKKSGLCTIAVPNAPQIENAYHIVDQYVKIAGGPKARIFIVHRLDRDTSGLLMFAKTSRAQNILRHHWDEMVLDRLYVAVLEGKMQKMSGVVKSYLMENPNTFKVYSTKNPAGKFAITHYRILQQNEQYALAELDLETGRKNQIRVHMSDIGHPIAGDEKYGGKTDPIERMCLHAFKLKFTHPITRKIIDLETPIPVEFKNLCKER
ncbi:MAG: RluA family pseudouridine synthase [Paludibacteraceae bacterium]|nr:RluA family pseudouridine synthase [Paludibacteraceae bacterium]